MNDQEHAVQALVWTLLVTGALLAYMVFASGWLE